MNWQLFPLFAMLSVTFWLAAVIFLYVIKKYKNLSLLLFSTATASLFLYGISLWISLERPAIRTTAEIRLWFAIFVSLLGIIQYLFWKNKLILSVTSFVGVIFVVLDYFHPDSFDKTLMPELHSQWLIPHVISFLLGFSLLLLSALFALFGLIKKMKNVETEINMRRTDRLVYAGIGFLTIGLLIGGLWAKDAWGHFWDWDTKETWSLISWMIFLIYLHVRIFYKTKLIVACFILLFACFILLGSWVYFEHLPLAALSKHNYNDVMP